MGPEITLEGGLGSWGPCWGDLGCILEAPGVAGCETLRLRIEMMSQKGVRLGLGILRIV